MRLTLAFACFVACACGPDRGNCLKSPEEPRYRDPWVSIHTAGKVTYPIVHPGYHYNVTVCDRWEFPEGKPEGMR
jgi:hypothetical protein